MASRHPFRPAALLALLLLALLPADGARAAPVVPVTGAQDRVALVPRTILLDPEGVLTPEIAARRLAAPDATIEQTTYSHGYISDVLWGRVSLDVAPAAGGTRYLALELPNFDRLDVFSVPEDGPPEPLFALGDRVAPTTGIRTRFHIAPLDLGPGRHVLLVRGETASTMTLALTLSTLDALLLDEQPFFALQAFYLGAMAMLFLGGAVLFAYTRHVIYLIFMFNIVTYCAIWLMINGTGPAHLWPGLAQRFPVELHAFIALAVASAFAFSASFLSTARVPRWIRRMLPAVSVLAVIVAIVCFLAPRSHAATVNAAVSQVLLPVGALLLVTTAIALFRGEPAARPLMITWTALIAASGLAVLRDYGVVPNTALTLTGPQLGGLLEALVFAYMLVDRFGRLQREKDRLQRAALAAAWEQEEVLARRVADRTAALHAANERLRSIVRSAPFPLVLVRESDGRILYVNQRICDLVGMPSETLLGSVSRDWFVDPERRETLVAAVVARGLVEGEEVQLRLAEGARMWVLMSIVRIVYDGEPVRLAALNDITRLKILEQDLRRTADAEAAAAARERDARRLQRQFVAMVSHEFRTPLAVIDGAAQNLAAANARDGGRLIKIRNAVTGLLRMVDACLVEERVDDGGLVLDRRRFDVRRLVADAVEATRAAASGRPIAYDPPPDAVTVEADQRLVAIALETLLESAVTYAPAGSRITVSIAPHAGAVEITVGDEGPGVPVEARERIFEKHDRAPGGAGTAGTGLGLHVVRTIVEAHGGSVHRLPVTPRGSRFVIRLPAGDPAGHDRARDDRVACDEHATGNRRKENPWTSR